MEIFEFSRDNIANLLALIAALLITIGVVLSFFRLGQSIRGLNYTKRKIKEHVSYDTMLSILTIESFELENLQMWQFEKLKKEILSRVPNEKVHKRIKSLEADSNRGFYWWRAFLEKEYNISIHVNDL